MSLSQMNELSKQGEDDVDPRERQGLLEDLEEVAAGVASSPPRSPEGACPSPTAREAVPLSQPKEECPSNEDEAGRSTREDPEDAESSQKEALRLKMGGLVAFLLLKYRTKEPASRSEMLSRVNKEHQDHFPEILSRASRCLRLLFGIEVKEVDPSNNIYFLGTTLGLTYDGGHCMPKTGLLVTFLCLILLEGDCAPEEEVWKSLNVMGLYDGREHCIYGEPRELITSVWVREQYVVYRQVANSDPARFEFLWGPRAHAETSKLKVLEYLLNLKSKNPLSEVAQRHEEEEA
ncbi:melanoma-associated antigen 8-like isoform X1 [Pteropus medius]|uniref:melanoma-associated antigen 8-like isoform X1 n=1 Tax=Pteropus vampyrus TaxID=132908 RepID=UPI00196A7F15|nr:melanoma-associated antigen 8-like isoform X1 [Pteropus giganteus]XP_039714580.1 melanoma-associated antigen 8-like isoform X1 [Pteropus giganteus]XP_039714583.1 melanoma-associated antigen 8-like isoform X1 [Pteropus giganteus]XP_039736326.1 melanoma-associated antigen 8-like isoform X1 [Pteropus giganteus]XP_039736327.1 melanoma-associated antigen 8-like isoform X1 [Pteropus giganteus]XP_039736328.1 melanoma-associated antigen 8-like isoform X1 [Pteropus giganteus]XP_039736329.1 melanoma